MGAQITILRGNASIPPSTAVTQRSLPTCSVANYVLPPCTVNSCLCTSCAVGAPASASLCSEHVTQTSYCRRGSSSGERYVTQQWHNVPLLRIRGLDPRLPPLWSRVRVSVTPSGFRGGRNGVWVGFSRGFSRFPLSQMAFHHFSTLISSISFHFISPCDGASGVVGRHPWYSRTCNIGLHLISSLDPTLCWTRVEDIILLLVLAYILLCTVLSS